MGEAEKPAFDAISKRTRANYSLTNFTLDELEAFLQETDDEDEILNIDEEEYKKFLVAVLHNEDGGELSKVDSDADDDDDDNDEDFVIQLAELLDSDGDENANINDKNLRDGISRRPVTRQIKRHKSSDQHQQDLLEQIQRPLRPILPYHQLGGGSLRTHDGPGVRDLFISCFTPNQIGQLYCLIYEHTQLLIQVFSLSVHDCSRQHIASQAQGLICQMIQKRDEAIASKKSPHSSDCFVQSCISSSVDDNISSRSAKSSSISQNNSHSVELQKQFVNGKMGSCSAAATQWVPILTGPIYSVLDVPPLALAGRYIDDVFKSISEDKQQRISSPCHESYEREPLFQLLHVQPVDEGDGDVPTRSTPSSSTTLPSAALLLQKKTVAASTVEIIKKQSVALVPSHISKLAKRFSTLFNPTLFPQKPPPASVVNRALFTEAEDELLAMGIMEYNTDWKAIQQRFLPCKSKHQIFVRQKNRCSAKASENPIKAVRRMKASPLTMKEIERVKEGLRIYKLDWMSIWKFVLPYRDPSLLPRQWRIALGTQKCYKGDDAKKEKRRLYELNKRKGKVVDLASWQQASNNEGSQVDHAGGNTDGESEAYVHQAFLADWGGPGRVRPIPISQPDHLSEVGSMPQPHLPNYMQAANHQSNGLKLQANPWPNQTHLANGSCLVKLAPELPPVSLPPTVRVIPESAFRETHSVDDGGSVSDLQQLHPLLFHLPEDGEASHHSSGSGSGSGLSFGLVCGDHVPDEEHHPRLSAPLQVSSSDAAHADCDQFQAFVMEEEEPRDSEEAKEARASQSDKDYDPSVDIMMEQEELSDSMDELEEQIEFECEEMEDSGGGDDDDDDDDDVDDDDNDDDDDDDGACLHTSKQQDQYGWANLS